MRALKTQFFLTFAVLGCLLPYLPLYLEQRGLSGWEVGWVLGAAGVGVLLTPVLTTLLADLHLENRTLIASGYALSALALAGMLLSRSFWPLLLTHGLFSLAYFPLMPLQDGMHFAHQERTAANGDAALPYHRIRVYGTVGFILPSLLLFIWLSYGPVSVTLVAGALLCLLGVANALLLPRLREEAAAGRQAPRSRLPTFGAVRILLRPRVLVFCAAIWLLWVGANAHASFYAIYLERLLGIEDRWVGLITNIGVAVEFFFMLAFGLLHRHLGLRWLMALGALVTAVRFALLWLFPSVPVAVATQVLHGFTVIALLVVPPVYLNAQAGAAYRNSIQGLYAMLIYGTGRITGSAISGYLADWSLTGLFAWAAGVCLVTALLFAAAFRDEPPPEDRVQNASGPGTG